MLDAAPVAEAAQKLADANAALRVVVGSGVLSESQICFADAGVEPDVGRHAHPKRLSEHHPAKSLLRIFILNLPPGPRRARIAFAAFWADVGDEDAASSILKRAGAHPKIRPSGTTWRTHGHNGRRP